MRLPSTILALMVCILVTACKQQPEPKDSAPVPSEAAAQGEAVRKEMDALPKAFQTPDYFKKNEPARDQAAPSGKVVEPAP